MSSQPTVTFREEDHSYTHNESGERFTSVTTLIGKFHEKFDAKKAAYSFSRKKIKEVTDPNWSPEWGKPEYWIKEWNRNSKESTDRGSAFHLKKELQDLALSGKLTSNREGFNYSQALAFLPNGLHNELLIYDEYWALAGQADRIIFQGDTFQVEDFKTNKEIKLESWCRETPTALSVMGQGEPHREYKMMYLPLNHLMDSNYWHYTIQLSTYAYLLERATGKQCTGLRLLHHPPLSVTDVQEEPVVYEVPYLKAEVEAMLQTWSKKPLPNDALDSLVKQAQDLNLGYE